ncbi:MAG: hypothetical protein KDD55_00330 [Bdellovibrionales bacterium]|nr:hypothetical protein [Bdellovibrionales bacterium]
MVHIPEAKERQQLWRTFSVLTLLCPIPFILKRGEGHSLILIAVVFYCISIGKLFWVWGNRDRGLQRRSFRAARCWFATSLIAFMFASTVSLPGVQWEQTLFGLPILPLFGSWSLLLLAHIVEFEAVWECRSDSLGYYLFLGLLLLPFLLWIGSIGYLSQISALDLAVVFHAASLLFLAFGFLLSLFANTSKISASAFQVCTLCSFGAELGSLWFALHH